MAAKKIITDYSNKRLRKDVHMKKTGAWAVIGASIFSVGLLGAPLFLLPALGAWAYMEYRLPKPEELEAEELEVIEALRSTANYNIGAARKRARGEDHEPMALYSMLEIRLGKEFLFSVSDDELNWMRDVYDQMVHHHIDSEAKLDTARENFRQLGRPRSRDLEAYYKGKRELTQEERDLAELEKLLEAER